MHELPIRTLELFAVFLDDPDREWYGLELARELGWKGGTLYPHLARLEALGWISSRWEDDSPPGRQYRRRFYRLADEGRRNGRAAARVRKRKRAGLRLPVPGWQGA